MLKLSVLDEICSICRLSPDEGIPTWAAGGHFYSITRTRDELSIVCESRYVPTGSRAEPGWRVLKVEGPLDFSLTGILAALAGALANAGVSLFAVSTYDTDYLLIREEDLETGIRALRDAGYEVQL